VVAVTDVEEAAVVLVVVVVVAAVELVVVATVVLVVPSLAVVQAAAPSIRTNKRTRGRLIATSSSRIRPANTALLVILAGDTPGE
jgi:hypothetical protein